MSIKKFKKLSKKVHAIIDNMEGNESLNTIERDLIANYLLQMYEIIRISPNYENREKKEKQVAHIDAAYVLEEIPAKPISKPSPVVPREDAPSRPAPSSVQAEVAVKVEKVTKKSNSEGAHLIDELLESFEMNDLSDKLRMQPIKDILKAMSINEKIFTINELFGGDKVTFDHTIRALNEAGSFQGAKDILTDEIIEKFNWTAPDKIKKLKQFLVLIKRRFI